MTTDEVIRLICRLPKDRATKEEVSEACEFIIEQEEIIDTLKNPPKGDYVNPCDGGCWFCHTKSDNMIFSREFNCYLHKKCLMAYQDNPEAVIFKREFNL